MGGHALSGEAEGVLLYYAYRDLRQCQAEVRDWYETLCQRQGLVGRVRVALDGLNVTVGGSLASLRQHIDAVEERFGRKGGAPIDFKLAESHGRKNTSAALQSVRLVF
jgi:predicted sulfurtransferase